MVLNLSVMPSLGISSYISNSIVRQDRIAVFTFAAGMNSRSKTIHNQKGQPCALEACMASWHPRRNSHAIRENGRATTSRWLDESLPLYKMVRPLLINRKSQASRAGHWTVTRDYQARSICRVAKPVTSPFGISRLRRQTDLACFTQLPLKPLIPFYAELERTRETIETAAEERIRS